MNIKKTSYNGVMINLHYYFSKNSKKREIRFLLFRLLNSHRNSKDTISKFKARKLSLYNLNNSHKMLPYKGVDTYSVSFTFVNPNLIKDDNYVDDIINLINEMYIDRKGISEDIFNRTKMEIIEEIKQQEDSILSVANKNINKLLYKNKVDQTNISGDLENYYDITYQDVLTEIDEFLNCPNFKVSILGSLDDSFINKLNKSLKVRESTDIDNSYNLDINSYDELVVDKSNKFSQTLIKLVYKFDNEQNDIETSYKMSIFANILGVSSISYLFEEIREAKGYCYYIGSTTSLEKDILEVTSLVSSNKYLDAIKDTNEVVLRVIKDFDNERLEHSKKRIKESLLSLKDQAYYESYDQREEYFLKRGLTLDKMIKIVDNVTKDEMLILTKSIKPILKYALVGEQSEEDW